MFNGRMLSIPICILAIHVEQEQRATSTREHEEQAAESLRRSQVGEAAVKAPAASAAAVVRDVLLAGMAHQGEVQGSVVQAALDNCKS